MHYEDKACKRKYKAVIVVYKHGVMKRKPRYNKDGLLTKSSVWYDITSIQEMRFFPPNLLRRIIAEPYEFFNKKLSGVEFEKYYEVKLTMIDRNTVEVSSVKCVSNHRDEFKRLH